MKNNNPFTNLILNEYEQEIEKSFESGDFEQIENFAEEKELLKQAAKNTLKKKPISLRLDNRIISDYKSIALTEGIPYQTLMASVLHKFANGRVKFVD